MLLNYILIPIVGILLLPFMAVALTIGTVVFLLGCAVNDRTKEWGFSLLVAIDQYVNALCLGSPDETISSRLGKKILDGRADVFHRGVCKGLNAVDKGHCIASIEADEGKN